MLNYYRLEEHIENLLQAEHVPGLALAIVHDQNVLYAHGFGTTSVEDGGQAVTSQTLFRVGSVTKPMTGTAVMRLVELGKLNLDTPVKHYLGEEFRLSDAAATEQVSLRMLLSHTAGLSTRYQPFGRRDPQAMADWVREELPELPLLAPPGKVFSYSNPGIDLAGYVAQVVSGKAYPDLLAEYVFAPLEMRRTTFDPLVAMTYPLAQAHKMSAGKTIEVEHRYAENSGHHPSGYAISTVLDMANFAIMQLHEGQFHARQVLSAESVRKMQSAQANLYTPTCASYGLTFRTETYKGLRLIGHDGDVNSFVCKFVLVSEAKIAIVIMVNWPIELDRLSHHILDELFDLPAKEAEPPEITPERANWPRYVGSYVGAFGLAKIQQNADQLMLDLNGEPQPLRAYSQDCYFGQKGKHEQQVLSVGFVAEDAQQPTRFIMLNGFVPCERIAEESLSQPNPSSWEAYTGTYTATYETFKVRFSKGRLLLKSETYGDEMLCKPLDKTRFVTSSGVIEFRNLVEGKASLLVQRDAFFFTRIM